MGHEMICYPYELASIAHGNKKRPLLRMRFPDFQNIELFGVSEDEIRKRATKLINKVIQARLAMGLNVPQPRPISPNVVEICPSTALQLVLAWEAETDTDDAIAFCRKTGTSRSRVRAAARRRPTTLDGNLTRLAAHSALGHESQAVRITMMVH